MGSEQKHMRIPTSLIPTCPVCGRPMTMNLRSDSRFVEDDGWHLVSERYDAYIRSHQNLRILFLEFGVGYNTPGIRKYPFWEVTARNRSAAYACINHGEAICPPQIEQQAVCVNADIGVVLDRLLELTTS